jgi:hypothetical protein
MQLHRVLPVRLRLGTLTGMHSCLYLHMHHLLMCCAPALLRVLLLHLVFMHLQDEVLIAGFGRRGHAVGDIPGVRFKVGGAAQLLLRLLLALDASRVGTGADVQRQQM